jgi:hypothetical protein
MPNLELRPTNAKLFQQKSYFSTTLAQSTWKNNQLELKIFASKMNYVTSHLFKGKISLFRV